MDQATYAGLHGIKPRTLRLWRERYLTTLRPTGSDAEPQHSVVASVDALRARVAVFEAELDALRAAVAACWDKLDSIPACRPTPVAARDQPPDDAGGMPAQVLGAADTPPVSKALLETGSDEAVTRKGDEVAIRALPFADPWSRGGGFLGPF